MAKSKKELRYHEILMELIVLREQNYELFMEKLYEALSGEFRGMVHDTSPIEEKLQALDSIRVHFQAREEYEKCAEIKKMFEELQPRSVKR
jgi:hypothetical protein